MNDRTTFLVDRKALIFLSVAGLLLAGLVVSMHLVPISTHTWVGRTIENGLHAPGFGIVTLLALFFLHPRLPTLTAYTTTFLLMGTLALLSELAQFFSARDASLEDIAADFLGITGFLALALALDPDVRARWPFRRVAVLGIFGMLATAACVKPVVDTTRIVILRALAVPAVLTFDNPWESAIYRPTSRSKMGLLTPPGEWPIQRGKVASVRLSGSRYAGVRIEPFPDWSGHTALSFVASSGSRSSMTVELRVRDAFHPRWRDQFKARVVLTSDPQKIEVPLDKFESDVHSQEIDLTKIVGLWLFAIDSEKGDVLLLDDFRLIGESAKDY